MAQEIERKFLVTGDYRSSATSSSHIAQGYICSDRGRTVRVRIRDDRGYLTIKGPSADNGLSRYEWEQEISLEDARDLAKLCQGQFIDKTRYMVPFAGHTFEVDEFHGDNEGLVMAEVELSTPDEPFERPAFLGKEVTGDRRYYNSQLMQHPYRTWEEP
ncbi:MAG TPA: CYTH domain-containing protein [Candidatus Bacteroides merdigallinarum]|uniref:CYTH domain-containing protein n=1 Tax=Candidatus Bacteroides merdigallinarum TaxID=2838473 RepID=A0A9D2E767_9BACE|nr:CYTH domain-containing protein [Candidatus Bacteroides merdigallinarum]